MPRTKKLNSVETQAAQEKIPSDIDKFLAAGGKIKHIASGITGQSKTNYGKHTYRKETK